MSANFEGTLTVPDRHHECRLLVAATVGVNFASTLLDTNGYLIPGVVEDMFLVWPLLGHAKPERNLQPLVAANRLLEKI